jgi:hypothetical protein
METNYVPDDVLLFNDDGIVLSNSVVDVNDILAAFLLNDNWLRQASVIPLEVTEASSFTLHPQASGDNLGCSFTKLMFRNT